MTFSTDREIALQRLRDETLRIRAELVVACTFFRAEHHEPELKVRVEVIDDELRELDEWLKSRMVGQ